MKLIIKRSSLLKIANYIFIYFFINATLTSCFVVSSPGGTHDCGKYMRCDETPDVYGQQCSNNPTPPYYPKYKTYKCNQTTKQWEVKNNEEICQSLLDIKEIVQYNFSSAFNGKYMQVHMAKFLFDCEWNNTNLKQQDCSESAFEWFLKKFPYSMPNCPSSENTIPIPDPYSGCSSDAIVLNINEPFGINEYSTARLDATQNDIYPFYTTYLVDTKSNDVSITDQIGTLDGSRIVYLNFDIAQYKKNYDGSYNKDITYEVLIYSNKGTKKLIKSIPIGYNPNASSNIQFIKPSCEPDDMSRVSGTIKTTLYIDAIGISSNISVDYYFALKTIYTSTPSPICTHALLLSGENACIEEIPSTKVTLKNYETITNSEDETVTYDKRVMNIMIGGNSNDQDITGVSTGGGQTFKDCFNQAFSDQGKSDIHAIPNFLPHPSGAGAGPNSEPQKIPIPEILIDSYGYAVLYSKDLENDIEVAKFYGISEYATNLITAFQRIHYAAFMWAGRLSQYFALYNDGKVTTANNVTQAMLDGYSIIRNQNLLPYVMIYGYKAFDVSDEVLATDDVTSYVEKGSSYTLFDNITATNKTFIETYKLYGGFYGFTFLWIGGNQGDKTMSYTIKGNIDNILVLTDKKGYYIISAFHELAHAWNDADITYANGTNTAEQHNKYVTGNGSKYCIFRYVNTIDLDSQVLQMQFSDEIENRMSNTFHQKP